METILKEVIEYITDCIDQQEDDDGNAFTWNRCKVPFVEEAINNLNYVNYQFIKRHFGENDFSIIAGKFGDINVDTFEDDVLSIELGDVAYNVTHNADFTISCVSAERESRATAEQILDAAEEYMLLFEAINTYYTDGIDAMIAKDKTDAGN